MADLRSHCYIRLTCLAQTMQWCYRIQAHEWATVYFLRGRASLA